MMVKMMVMALAMGALFCSCNSAGGYDAYEAQESKASNIELGGSSTVAPSQRGPFTIIIPEISVSVSGADEAVQSETGTTAIKNMNPYTLQQAETMSTSGGVNYEDFKNIKSVSKSSLGNDASENLYVKMAPGAWTMVRKVDFGTNGARQFTLRARGTGKLEIRVDGKSKAAAATVEFSSTTFQDFTIDLDPALFKKVHHLYFVFTESTNAQFDSWQFAEYDPTGVFEIETTEDIQSEKQFFDLSGRRLPKDSKHRGLVIEQYTDENGTKKVRKHF